MNLLMSSGKIDQDLGPTLQEAFLCERCGRLYDDKRGTKRFTPKYEGVGVKLEMIVCMNCLASRQDFSPRPHTIPDADVVPAH